MNILGKGTTPRTEIFLEDNTQNWKFQWNILYMGEESLKKIDIGEKRM